MATMALVAWPGVCVRQAGRGRESDRFFMERDYGEASVHLACKPKRRKLV